MAGNTLGCPHQRDADWIVSVLVREVSKATTLSDKMDAAFAILDVRRYVEPMVKEWEHLSGVGSCQPCTKEAKRTNNNQQPQECHDGEFGREKWQG